MRPTFIIARRRGGSDALGEILRLNGLTFFDDALDVQNPRDYSLGSFLRGCNVGAAELLATPDVILEEYLCWCEDRAGSDRFCVESKDDVLHVFNGGAWAHGQRPNFVHHIRDHHYPLVFLVRRQVFRQALEVLMLEAAGGHGPGPGETMPSPAPFAVDVRRCQALMKRAADTAALMGRWFRRHPAYHEIIFEDVFADDAVSESGAARLEEVFGTRLVSRVCTIRSSRLDLRNLVTNRDELIAAFAGGPHAEEVKSVLG
jgi:hypothetical protein